MVVVVVVLAISNILVNRALPAWSYVPWNVSIAVVVGWLALHVRTPEELGLGRWTAGARWGGAIAAGVLAVYVVAAIVPPTRDLFRDERVGEGWPFLVYHVLIRIPIGTVLLEEIAFRAVLPSLLAPSTPNGPQKSARSGRFLRTEPVGRAILVASMLFGLWHVLPAWDLGDVNPILADVFGDDWLGHTIGVVLAVLGTFVAGVSLCLLRVWSGSVLAPMLVHAATNSLGYAFAWWIGT